MIDPYFESRIENWARANRVRADNQRSPTLVIMEMLRLQNGDPTGCDGDELTGKGNLGKSSPKLDLKDADLFDKAYRDGGLDPMSKRVIRMWYFKRFSPSKIETALYLPRKTFFPVLERVVLHFKNVVESMEKDKS